jgi:hypothetical protein
MSTRLRFTIMGGAGLLFGACGSFDAAEDMVASDAGGGDGSDDAAVDARGSAGGDGSANGETSTVAPCDVMSPFTSLLPLQGSGMLPLGAPANAFSPTLTADESLVFFQMPGLDGGSQIVSSARQGASFAPPQPITGIPIVDRDVSPSLRLDGKLLVFASDRDNPGVLSQLHVFGAARAADGGFETPAPLAIDVDAATLNETSPFVSADGTELYFSSPLAGTLDIYRARATGGGAFGVPSRVDALSSLGAEDDNAVLSADGLTVYFSSDRAAVGLDGSAIYVAHRPSTGAEFELPQVVKELYGTADRRPSWLSPDGCRLYFTTIIDGTRFALFVAGRAP